jgi:hypothetical protein
MNRTPGSRLAIFVTLLLSFPLAAQEIRMGALDGNNAIFSAVPVTLIDWSSPANAVGAVNTASVAWRDASTPCDNIFYVRFYAIASNAFIGTMIAERGPFRAVNGINTVTLEPPVNVTPDTYIGVRRAAGDESCGRPYGTISRTPGRVLLTNSDFLNGSLAGITPSFNFKLQAQASNTPSVRVSTLPIVGAAPGAFGSFFRSSVTLANPSPYTVRGKLVLRLSDRSGTDADPSLNYTIPPNGTLTYPDVMDALGLTGKGSLDVYTTASPAPIVTARVFNDTGSGTSGLAEDAVPAQNSYFAYADIFIPADLANFRLNIGVRTFAAADLTFTTYDAAGSVQSSVFKSYDANYFEQLGASSFVNGELPAGGKIVVTAVQKEFIVYGAVTDNKTNDPSMRIGND